MVIKMKKLAFIVTILLILTISVITSASVADRNIPDLVGTWKYANIQGATNTGNFTSLNGTEIPSDNKWVIESQNGLIFKGYKEFSPVIVNGDKVIKEMFTGAISKDLTQAYVKEQREGAFNIVYIYRS